ncbi:hypothetical protein RFW61_15055, partial [Acinetobacter baumannii]|nr:hypothetical protein [Acinetobacter baumannii]
PIFTPFTTCICGIVTSPTAIFKTSRVCYEKINISENSEVIIQIRNALQQKQLVKILEDWNIHASEEFHAVWIGHDKYVPNRVRTFLDF